MALQQPGGGVSKDLGKPSQFTATVSSTLNHPLELIGSSHEPWDHAAPGFSPRHLGPYPGHIRFRLRGRQPARRRDAGFIRGEILHTYYDGRTDDLLTGGLGSAGLAKTTPPDFADQAHP